MLRFCDFFLCSTRAQKVSSGREGVGGGRMVSRFRVFCWHRITYILQRGEEVHASKPIYSKRIGPSLACLPGKHHLNVNLLGDEGVMIAQRRLLAKELRNFSEGDLLQFYRFPNGGGGVRTPSSCPH